MAGNDPNDIVTQARWFINASRRAGGNVRLRRLTNADVDDESSVDTVTEMGEDRPVGFVDVPGGMPISLEFRQTKGAKPDVDWDYLKAAKEIFSLTRQNTGGRRRQFPECRVSKVTETGNSEGEHTYTVEVACLRAQAL